MYPELVRKPLRCAFARPPRVYLHGDTGRAFALSDLSKHGLYIFFLVGLDDAAEREQVIVD